MDGSEVMHHLWNRDLAAVLNFRYILNNLRYDGTIPVRFTRVIRIGRIRRQAEEDLQMGFCNGLKKLRKRFFALTAKNMVGQLFLECFATFDYTKPKSSLLNR
ncbi:hypothetical protein PHYBLDRAFT_75496 [Phycomyces blakesleeanus NRRL 1555(-)]|uniref:Uncharacterized protein n=1 Tax=Phycomyces blakesleeanus (strain ATCC 8743b / DSM 1359 / FGSC 10004 / NBRC 33097 / NRRL 1555) TaxID=763407 RepID=A0A163ELJ1_PHYB8|nr:hypothetical protein PHYBLDRAFT_75496 [Phycomyces blakesleeanus NRRL 1555(-)]OAD79320.1 hypothetical protein PHYBLDRAFT_75496 [Phycomyces blakesleeanus NRRL 1555(-)]|eukprot:XP_018297360.1 hypothetical protein PHYBLDRAFT_75496 [Phycomyces blakesleeanus NRRL 1555(-)]